MGPAFALLFAAAAHAQSNGCWRGLPDGKLCTDGMFFKNGRGETVILRGVNLAGTSKIPPFLPLPARGAPALRAEIGNTVNFDFIGNSDFSGLDVLPGWGVNVIRLLFVWEAYEPVMNQPSATYLQMLQRIAAEAWSRGIYTIVDFHQDAFARFLAAGCGEGLPRWAVDMAGVQASPPDNTAPACLPWMQKALADPRVAKSFDALYSTPTLRLRYLDLMRKLASGFKDIPGVIGYDVLNEPFSRMTGTFGPYNPILNANDQDYIWHETQLTGLYKSVYDVIRQVDGNGILFLEPNLNVDGGIQTDLLPPCISSVGGRACNIAYAPHYYDRDTVLAPRVVENLGGQPLDLPLSSVFGYQGSNPIWGVIGQGRLINAFRNMVAVARTWNVPLFLGEFGATINVNAVEGYMNDLHTQLNTDLASAAQWSFSPGWTPRTKDGWNGEDLSINDDRGRYRPRLFFPRPYPQSISGVPQALYVQASEHSFSLGFTWKSAATSSNETVIYVPQIVSIQRAGGLAGREAPNLGGSCARNLNPAALFQNPDFLSTIVKCMGAVGGPGLQTIGPVQCSFRAVPKNRSFAEASAGLAAGQGGAWNRMVRVSCVTSQPGASVTAILRASE